VKDGDDALDPARRFLARLEEMAEEFEGVAIVEKASSQRIPSMSLGLYLYQSREDAELPGKYEIRRVTVTVECGVELS
jgi:hypothetical protein